MFFMKSRKALLQWMVPAIFFLLFLLTSFTPLLAGVQLDLETGAVISGRNDVRIPGDTGTDISLTDSLHTDPSLFIRVRLTYTFVRRHSLSVLIAPLTLESSGQVDHEVIFVDVAFPPDTPLEATYTFNSYRLTYRYDLVKREKLTFGLGFTAKIRDAAISLKSADAESVKTNTGFVPLLNFRLDYMPWNRLGFLLEGDALAAPQGRAEDVLLALKYVTSDSLTLKFGYRLLEGGADNDEVYNFALLHYIIAGVIISF